MFTAKIKSIAKFKGRITIVVEYSNGTETFQEELSASTGVDLTWLQTQVRTRIKSLQAAYDFADSLVVNSSIDITDPPALTQAEIDRNTFIQNYTRWTSVKRAIDAGILTGNETKVIELKTKVQNDFKPAYLDII